MTAAARSMNGKGPSTAALSDRLHAVEIEQVQERGKRENHEAVCAERYAAIDGKLGDLHGIVKTTAAAVQDLTTARNIAIGMEQGAAKASKPKWWAEPVLIALLSGAMMLAGWVGNHIFETATKSPVHASAKGD